VGAEEDPPAQVVLLDIPKLTGQLRDLQEQAQAAMGAFQLDPNLRLDAREQVALHMLEILVRGGTPEGQHGSTAPVSYQLFGDTHLTVNGTDNAAEVAFELADAFMSRRKQRA